MRTNDRTPPSSRRHRWRRGRPLAIAPVALVLIGAGIVWQSHAPTSVAATPRPERHPQRTWAACNRNANSTRPSTFHPLSDGAAAALVTPEPETRPGNDREYVIDGKTYSAPNETEPTAAQLREFRAAKTPSGQTNVQFNPYYAYVDGRDGMRHPSTDDLIQWAAHKWGIPEDWLRAEYVHESYWNQFMVGDDTPVKASWYTRYPVQSRLPHSDNVYQSLGITQVRWAPDGSLHAGTEPLRWRSTSFNIDYQAATLRFYYDNPQRTRSSWGDSSYRPCEAWNSLGGWFRPYPWNNAGQATYVKAVKQILAQRGWTSSSFVSWKPTLPAGVTFKR